MKKYGINKFSIELIETLCSQKELNKREFYWINFYNSVHNGYNTKNSEGKCGGDTYSNNVNKCSIREKISESKRFEKNINARKVKATNIVTNQEIFFGSFSQCQKELDIPRHDIIGRRCTGKIKKPYKNEWLFEYI